MKGSSPPPSTEASVFYILQTGIDSNETKHPFPLYRSPRFFTHSKQECTPMKEGTPLPSIIMFFYNDFHLECEEPWFMGFKKMKTDISPIFSETITRKKNVESKNVYFDVIDNFYLKDFFVFCILAVINPKNHYFYGFLMISA